MYVKIVGAFNSPEVLIKDPSVYTFNIEDNKRCEVAIENEYLMVKTFSNTGQVERLMREMEDLKYNQKNGSPLDSVFFEAQHVIIISQKELAGDITKHIRNISYQLQRSKYDK